MSKMGLDYKSGGTCFYKGKKIVNVENQIDVGDIGIFYATLKHAVNPVKDTNKNVEESSGADGGVDCIVLKAI